ncbi:hypothetical protein [Sutcliffiella halmapala]|uniref:hypothetical protein n=1 Tax=Sutcliffiella halmapala TaxID=79882 RepID=UPI000994E1E5|nr:hypothetical protein [Sutcliffiella halmapala]
MSEDQSKKEEKVEDIDPFTRMMFGRPIKSEKVEPKPEDSSKKKVGEEYYALIEQVDSIMESVNKLKPMLKEFSPLIDYFKKK